MDPQQIADSLTEAQRKMLRWNCAGFVLLRQGWTRWRLARKGLIRPWLFHGSWKPTPLGLSVRRILETR